MPRRFLKTLPSLFRPLHTQPPPSRLSNSPNPGMNATVFRSVFEPPPHHLRRRYKLRWDWHLRLFIYSCGPPGMLFGLFQFVDWWIEDSEKDIMKNVIGDIETKDLIMKKETEATGGKENEGGVVAGLVCGAFENRLAELEKLVHDMKEREREQTHVAVLEEATRVAIGIGRGRKEVITEHDKVKKVT